jgi:hypothetical protein
MSAPATTPTPTIRVRYRDMGFGPSSSTDHQDPTAHRETSVA